jgi:uncharacterized repeat protein (TIGR01451 family)
VTDEEPFAQVNFGDTGYIKLDIVAAASMGAARPGFPTLHTFQISDPTHEDSGPITATAQLDPLMTYMSASITPTSVIGNTLTWDLPALTEFEQHCIQVHAQLPPDPQLIGATVSFDVAAYQTLQEHTLANNVHNVRTVITGSYDPNDKVVWPRDLYELGIDSVLDYTIRFQNTGTDTAFNITVTDTLAAELDIETFQAGAASHPYALSFKPGRVVEWRFNNILLPDSNTNEQASHGLIGFQIRPVQPVALGTVFENKANIYFDFNPPVITEPCVLEAGISTGVIEVGASALSIYPNPAATVIQVAFADRPAAILGVFDMAGARFDLPMERNAKSITMDVRDLPKGMYSVWTTAGSARFVKQ